MNSDSDNVHERGKMNHLKLDKTVERLKFYQKIIDYYIMISINDRLGKGNLSLLNMKSGNYIHVYCFHQRVYS